MRFNRTVLILIGAVLLAVLISQSSVPSQAQNNGLPPWTVTFYNNPYLLDPVVVQRTDGNIAWNWGTNAPAEGVNADNFSARWTTGGYLNGGRYRFTILADDGIQLWVNGVRVINTYFEGKPGQIQTIDMDLPTGETRLQVDYHENTLDAYIFMVWGPAATTPSTISIPGAPTPTPVGFFPTATPVGFFPSATPVGFFPSATPFATATPGPALTPVPGGPWLVQYYPNADLSGGPVIQTTDNGPNVNWGSNAPATNFPADNFSVRWTRVENLGAGVYRVQVAADDGVRVYINGVRVIDAWNGPAGANLTGDVNLGAAQAYITVEYREFGGLAFINYGLTQISGQPQPPQVGVTAIATITAGRLNVRTAPGLSNPIITRVNRGETYPILGRSPDGQWWQIQVGGQSGWVSAAYIEVSNVGSVPVTGSVDQPPPSPVALVESAQLNVRSGPGTQFGVVATIRRDERFPIIGRTADNGWWQIRVNNLTGWVTSNLITAINAENVPITDAPAQVAPQPTGIVLTTRTNLRIRSGPSTSTGTLTVIPQGTTVAIFGRNATATWFFVEYGSTRGWVSAAYTILPQGLDPFSIAVL